MTSLAPAAPLLLGRYQVFEQFAEGGMATVHMARLVGAAGFTRTVVVKRLHAHLARDPELASMFLDEAHMASRVRHPNVVQTLDVVHSDGELLLVMDYVHGEALSVLLRAMRDHKTRTRPSIVVSIMSGTLQGLHAAHEARNDKGDLLELVHRDVSPQNILVGIDGIARVLDFGVAKATGRIHSTRDGQLKGKLAYMAPEQLGGAVTRRTDIFAAGVVAWEALTGERLFSGGDERAVISRVLAAPIRAPSELCDAVPASVDAVVLRALSREPKERFATAKEMALALDRALTAATSAEVGDWVEETAKATLQRKAELLRIAEAASSTRDRVTIPEEIGVAAGVRDEPSSVSLSAASRPTQRRIALLAGVTAFACLGLVGVLARRAQPVVAEVHTEPLPRSVVAPVPQPAAEPIVTPSAVAPVPRDSASASPSTSARKSGPARRPPASPRVAAAPPPPPLASTNPVCDPPYHTGPNGEKLWIKECF